MRIPAGLLADTIYTVDVNVVALRGDEYVPSVAHNALSFQVFDPASKQRDALGGVVSPRLAWELEPERIEAESPAERKRRVSHSEPHAPEPVGRRPPASPRDCSFHLNAANASRTCGSSTVTCRQYSSKKRPRASTAHLAEPREVTRTTRAADGVAPASDTAQRRCPIASDKRVENQSRSRHGASPAS